MLCGAGSGGRSMVMKTPEEYFADGREWLVKAERIAKEVVAGLQKQKQERVTW